LLLPISRQRSSSAALLLSFLFITLECRMLKRVLRVRAAPVKPAQGKGKIV
jgi:hypothetical protein